MDTCPPDTHAAAATLRVELRELEAWPHSHPSIITLYALETHSY